MAKASPQDIENKKFFSNKLNYLLDINNKKQVDLSRDLGIPKSTITGYVKGTSLPTAGNIQKLADYFNVLKSDLDLKFLKNSNTIEKIIAISTRLESERQENVLSYAKFQLEEQEKSKVIPIKDKSYLEVNAAHHRTDIDVTDEMKKHDDDIMDDENF